jgi:rod shape-determining protein MreC
MPKERTFLPRLFSAAIFIFMEVAALQMLSRNAELQRIWVARTAHGVMGTVWGSTQAISNYFSLHRINEDLVRENFELREELEAYRTAAHAVHVDTLGVGHGRIRGFEYIPAEVIKISRNKQHNYMILNKGFEDGIQEKSGIITRSGIVGIVDAVSAHHAYAFSFQNSDISISGRFGDEGATGLLVWDGVRSNGAILQEVPLQYKYAVGDTVYSSGHSLMFPPDIPLGVAGGARVINGATNEITVDLFQDFTAIRYVTVVHNTAFDEVEEFGL